MSQNASCSVEGCERRQDKGKLWGCKATLVFAEAWKERFVVMCGDDGGVKDVIRQAYEEIGKLALFSLVFVISLLFLTTLTMDK